MKELSFEEFASTGYDEWLKVVQKELGDKSPESLIWKNENGFEVEPYKDGYNSIYAIDKPQLWEIHQEASHEDAKQLNQTLHEMLMGGVNSIGISKAIDSYTELEIILKDIQLNYIALHFTFSENTLELPLWLVKYCAENKVNTKALRGSCFIRPDLHDEKNGLKQLIDFFKTHFSLFKLLPIDAVKIHSGGGNNVHELAYALSTGNEYLFRMVESGFSVDDASAALQFNFATGSSFFMEIAKYRAFRVLWQTVVKMYEPVHACSTQCYIHAETSKFQQTTKDHYNNLLRATTQAMSAIIGGVNSLHVWPAYEPQALASTTSLRIARNIQHLLLEESYLNVAGDVAAGSYYIETITTQLVDQTWLLFQKMENGGGETLLQTLIKESMLVRRKQIQDGEKVIVGVNKYQNKNERPAQDADLNSLTGFIERL